MDFPMSASCRSASDYVTEEIESGWLLVVAAESGLVFFEPGRASMARSPAPFKFLAQVRKRP
jgi:hypothetical protein